MPCTLAFKGLPIQQGREVRTKCTEGLVSSAGGIQRVDFQLCGARKSCKDKVARKLFFGFCRILTKEIVERTFHMDELDEQRLRDKKFKGMFEE